MDFEKRAGPTENLSFVFGHPPTQDNGFAEIGVVDCLGRPLDFELSLVTAQTENVEFYRLPYGLRAWRQKGRCDDWLLRPLWP